MKNILKLISLVPKYKSQVARAMAATSVLGLISLANPYFFKLIVDNLVELVTNNKTSAEASNTIIILVGILGVVSVLNAIFSYFQERVAEMFFINTLTSLRNQVFDHLGQLSIDYYEKTRVGEIMQRTNNAVGQLAGWLLTLIQGYLNSLVTSVFILIYLWFQSPLIGLIMSVVVPLSIYISIYKVKQTQPIRKIWLGWSEKANGTLNELITHVSTVRSMSSQGYVRDQYQHSIAEFKDGRIRQFKVEWSANFMRAILISFGVVSSIGIVSFGAVQGTFTAGDIFLISLYVQRLTGSIFPIGRLITNTGDMETSAERVIEILETKPTVVDAPDAVQLSKLEFIEFKNVSFSYPGKKAKVLDKISFKIDPGQTFALVGKSGVGKTTITKLLLRFYEPTEGQISINGAPIQNFTQDSVRQQIGVVMQDVALFNDTIEANLELANPKVPKSKIKEAATQAHASVFIDKLPDRYKTLVGERGIKLSGGEKQRVAIARAIIKDPKLIILDEATSALDSESERHVQAGLRELMTGRTSIIIAHRLSTVMRADQILVLDKGKIVESGTHGELLETDSGIYSKLFKLQSGALVA